MADRQQTDTKSLRFDKIPDMTDEAIVFVGLWQKPTSFWQFVLREQRLSRGHEQAYPWPIHLHVMAERKAIHIPGHSDIREEHVDVARFNLQNRYRFRRVLSFPDLEALINKYLGRGHTDQRLVLSNDDDVHPRFQILDYKRIWAHDRSIRSSHLDSDRSWSRK